MNRDEYMESYTGKSKEEQQQLHHQYYLGLARAGGLALPNWMRDKVRFSKDEHFNDIPLDRWDAMTEMARGAIARANKTINGQSVWSLSDGVCIFKALAYQYCKEIGVR